jgi:hypothetical protein
VFDEATEAAARALYGFDHRHQPIAQLRPFEALSEAERFAYRRKAAVMLGAAAAVIESIGEPRPAPRPTSGLALLPAVVTPA